MYDYATNPYATDPVERAVYQRTANARTNAWWLWLLLGGFNAHLAYLYPKNRWLILALTVIGLVLTAGIAGLFLWPWNWLLIKGGLVNYRTHVRAEVEADMLRQRALYGQPLPVPMPPPLPAYTPPPPAPAPSWSSFIRRAEKPERDKFGFKIDD